MPTYLLASVFQRLQDLDRRLRYQARHYTATALRGSARTLEQLAAALESLERSGAPQHQAEVIRFPLTAPP